MNQGGVLLSASYSWQNAEDKAETEPFNSNMGSPQGDALSGVLFDIYFEESLCKVRNCRHEMKSNKDDEDNGNMPLSF